MCEMNPIEINQKANAGNEIGNVRKKVHSIFPVRKNFARGGRKKKKMLDEINLYNVFVYIN